ncbi:MAG: hypothetical protein Q9227_000239 [Pyrenula ochraceoflavens]
MSTASPAPGPSRPKVLSQTKAWAEGLYTQCSNVFSPETLMFQDDIVQANIDGPEDLKELMQVIQYLVDQRLFQLHETLDKRLAWKVVPKDDAERYKKLAGDEKLIYQAIETAGSSGIWSGHIKNQTGLHQQKVQKAIKSLQQRDMINHFVSAKHSGRKMFIRKGVKPSDTAAGGSWFTDGELDRDLVSAVGNFIVLEVAARSWVKIEEPRLQGTSSTGKNHKRRMSTVEAEELRASVLGNEEPEEPPRKRMKTEDGHRTIESKLKARYMRHEPGYTGYPTLEDITSIVNSSELTSGVTLASTDISQLLDVLCWDDRLYRVEQPNLDPPLVMYKSLMNREEAQVDVAQRRAGKVKIGPGNGLTDIPCGRCPVFDLCEEGGPVNADNCKYFDEWFQKLEF